MRAWRARCGGTPPRRSAAGGTPTRLRGRVGQLGAVGDDAGREGPLTSRPFKGGGIRPGLMYVKLGAVHSVQIADETFVAADPARVGAAVGDPSSWRRWWPDLRLRVIEDRGPLGIRWAVTGPLTGTIAGRSAAALLSARRTVRGRGLAIGQDESGEIDASAPSRGQENGFRGEDDAGALPARWGFSGA
jgi:hypothetical protein